jgi:hypothetical protein
MPAVLTDRRAGLPAFLLICSALPVDVAAAQQASAGLARELDSVPVVGSLSVPAEVRAALEPGDHLIRSRATYARAWAITGTAGRRVTIDALTDDPEQLDPVLAISGPGLAQPIENDDGAGACNARIELTFPETGRYRVVATTWRPWRWGTFSLRVSRAPEPKTTWGCNDLPFTDDFEVIDVSAVDTIAIGADVEGALTNGDREDFDGRRQRGFALRGEANVSATVELSSSVFRPALRVTGPQLHTTLTSDGVEVTDAGRTARVELTFPKTGTYKLVVTSTDGPVTGPFRLRVRERPPEPVDSWMDPPWAIVPEERVGAVVRGMTLDELTARVGFRNTREADIPLGEGETEPGTLAFPDDSLLRLEILWREPAPDEGLYDVPREVRLRGQTSFWRTAEGITLGTTLRELERLNGGPFSLSGWGWDYGGTVYHWDGGALDAELRGVFLRLGGGDWDRLSAQAAAQLDGDEALSSAMQAVQQVNPAIVEIRVVFDP